MKYDLGPVQRIYLAIKQGKMNLPEEYRGVIDPLAFIDASPSDTIATKEAVLKIQREVLAVLENQRRRIQELRELLGYGFGPFHTLFRDNSVKPRDYNGLKRSRDAVQRIYLAVKEGKMNLPEEYRGKIDPKAFLDASDTQAAAMVRAFRNALSQGSASSGTSSQLADDVAPRCGPAFGRLRAPVERRFSPSVPAAG